MGFLRDAAARIADEEQFEHWPAGYLLLPPLLIFLWLLIKVLRVLWEPSGTSHDHGKILVSLDKEKGRLDQEYLKSMGNIEPLADLKWETVEPDRVYKFRPKYFLTMGLQSTDINHITTIDRRYISRLEARRQILHDHPAVVACLPSAVDAVNELYSYLVGTYLPTRYPTIFHLDGRSSISARPGTHLLNRVTGEALPLTPPPNPVDALRLLAVTVTEDFLILLPCSDEETYSLQALIWCYPVGFDPADKLGEKLRELHAPVPGYAAKLQNSMDRYFARMEVGKVVCRTNWSMSTSSDLYIESEYHLHDDNEQSPPREPIDPTDCNIRCELQTFFTLPRSGARVMSLHLYLYPLPEIKHEGLGEDLCQAIDGLEQGNVPAMSRYKRAPVWRDDVVRYLRA